MRARLAQLPIFDPFVIDYASHITKAFRPYFRLAPASPLGLPRLHGVV